MHYGTVKLSTKSHTDDIILDELEALQRAEQSSFYELLRKISQITLDWGVAGFSALSIIQKEKYQ